MFNCEETAHSWRVGDIEVVSAVAMEMQRGVFELTACDLGQGLGGAVSALPGEAQPLCKVTLPVYPSAAEVPFAPRSCAPALLQGSDSLTP